MRKFPDNFLGLIFLLLLVNCQVNKVLLPTKNAIDKREFKWEEGKDLIELKVAGENLQPYYFKNKDTLQHDFTIKSYYFKTESGRKINGWLLKSKTEVPKISVFALHGNSGNLNSQYRRFIELTKYGFQIFLFDYPGFGYSEGKSTRANAVVDSYSVFDFFKNLDEIKNTPKVIYGQSIGGNFSIPVATRNQDDIEGLVLEGTFISFNAIANRKVPLLGGLVIKENDDNRLNLKNFKKPVLIIHSKEDKLIPLEMGRQLYENANEPKEFFEIDRPHISGISYYGKEISEKIHQMIK
ncbi:alpha/beta hydrolase [Kaistella sp.]|uniref:alpha/beta hydrolase n=1 Tax=Kaistella sp. TaxID=2782235 RepID=UPI0035A0506C